MISAIEDRPGTPPGAYIVDVSGMLIFPGLINAHDHLEFNCYPRLGDPGSYANGYEWGLDITRRRRPPVVDQVLQIPLEARLLAGGYKNLLAGVTTVCQHGPYYKLFDRGFPVQVVKRYGWCHSLGFSDDVVDSYRRTPPGVPWIIHLAEGTDARAKGELGQLADLGCLGANTVIVHGVALSQSDIDLMARRGAGLIWCPASNLFMLGRTAPIRRLLGRSAELPAMLRAGHMCVTLALGSDSRLTGSEDLLAELKVACGLELASDEELFRMVTSDAARLLRLDDRVGAIESGKQADLLIMNGNAASPYRALATAPRQAIQLILIRGQPVYGKLDFIQLFRQWGQPFHQVSIEDQPHLVSGDPVQIGRSLELLAKKTDSSGALYGSHPFKAPAYSGPARPGRNHHFDSLS